MKAMATSGIIVIMAKWAANEPDGTEKKVTIHSTVLYAFHDSTGPGTGAVESIHPELDPM